MSEPKERRFPTHGDPRTDADRPDSPPHPEPTATPRTSGFAPVATIDSLQSDLQNAEAPLCKNLDVVFQAPVVDIWAERLLRQLRLDLYVVRCRVRELREVPITRLTAEELSYLDFRSRRLARRVGALEGRSQLNHAAAPELSPLLSEAVGAIHDECERRDINTRIEIRGVLSEVVVDRHRFGAALSCALDDALARTECGGTISILAEDDEGSVHLRVVAELWSGDGDPAAADNLTYLASKLDLKVHVSFDERAHVCEIVVPEEQLELDMPRWVFPAPTAA
ncbi:MAG: hypothetical protein AAGF12_16040 [Myxococcota bacterium]